MESVSAPADAAPRAQGAARPTPVRIEQRAPLIDDRRGRRACLVCARDDRWPHPTMLEAAVAAGARDDIGITVLSEDGEDETFLSYRALLERAAGFAAELRASGLKKHERVVLVLPTSHEFVIGFFGVQLAGGVPVPAYPPPALAQLQQGLARIGHIARSCDAAMLVADPRLTSVLGEVALSAPTVRWVRGLSADAVTPRTPQVDVLPSDIAFVQFTSGSTSDPKGVEISQRAVIANVYGLCRMVGVGPEDKMVCWVPLYHDMGLMGGLMCPLLGQFPLTLMSPVTFMLDPMVWLRAMSETRATFSMGPNFAFARAVARISDEEAQSLDLSSVRMMLNGAEFICADTLRKFADKFGPAGFSIDAFTPAYGLAEATVAVSACAPGQKVRTLRVNRDGLDEGVAEDDPDGVEVVSCGPVLPTSAVRVVGDDGTILDEREVGHIQAGGPNLLSSVTAGDLPVTEDGWVITGDLGFVEGGELFVTGRLKNVIVVRGRNIRGEEVEALVNDQAGVKKGTAVAVGLSDNVSGDEQLHVFFETRTPEDEHDALGRAIESAINERFSVHAACVALAPGSIPKTSSGKVQRQAALQKHLEGTLRPERTTRLQAGVVLTRSVLGRALTRLRR